MKAPLRSLAQFRALLATSAFLSLLASVMRAPSTQRSPPWVGSVRCELQVEARGYLHQETHIWSVSAGSYFLGNSASPAWVVTGQGWSRRKDGKLTTKSDWTINGQGDGNLSFEPNPSTGVITVRVQPTIPSQAGALTGTTQKIDGDTPSEPTRLAPLDVQAWVFDPIVLNPNVSDGMAKSLPPREIRLNNRGPLQPPEVKATLNVAWSFAPQGSAQPALPPSTLVARAPTFPDGKVDTTASSGTSPSSGGALDARVAELERRLIALEAALSAHVSADSGIASTSPSNTTSPANNSPATSPPVAGLPGSRTEKQYVPDPKPKIDKGRYRVTATHVLVTETFPYSKQNVSILSVQIMLYHARDNEIFVTADTRVIDRRNGAAIGGRTFVKTPVHGDSASDPAIGGPRVNAGTFGFTGGIRSGDDIKLRNTVGSDYSPVIVFEGELTAGVEYVLVRPAVWFTRGMTTSFWLPYITRVTREQAPDLVKLPLIRDAVSKPGISVDVVPELTTTGPGGDEMQDKPFGQVFTGRNWTGSGTWTDRAIVLTREKVEAFLASSPAELKVEFLNTRATGAREEGACTLFLKFERL